MIGVLDYVKDKISKESGVPWHQIKPKQLKNWRSKENEPV